jgi:mannose-6-phosphate isomerase-like protein (cupin superfamily)
VSGGVYVASIGRPGIATEPAGVISWSQPACVVPEPEGCRGRHAAAICHGGVMDIQTVTGSPRNERGQGQVSYLLLAGGQFESRQLCVTWVECQPGSQQSLHRHLTQEQAYVIIRGHGTMLAGGRGAGSGRGHAGCHPAWHRARHQE